MKREAKVAWPKTHPLNAEILKAINSGQNISHEELISAVNDPDGMKVFDPGAHQAIAKAEHVIFHYGIYLQRTDGTVAVFDRARMEDGGKRMNDGRSVLISRSAPASPYYAVPRSIQHQICTGGNRRIGNLTPIGISFNPMPPKHGIPRPSYLFALFRNDYPDDLPLHGRFRTSPDKFLGWMHPSDFSKEFFHSGILDQFLSQAIATNTFDPVYGHEDGFSYSPNSRLVSKNHAPDSFEAGEYTEGKNVFISHAAEDSFSAYALFRMLVDESSRSIYPTVDLDDLREGEKLEKIDTLINEADCIVLLITPNLIKKSIEQKRTGVKDWVKYEIESAIKKGKPIIGFKLGTVETPYYVPKDLIANDRSFYTDWLKEVAGLIDRIHERYNR